MNLNRLSGLFVAIAGAVLFFWITPDQIEIIESGWLKPHTLPDIITIALIILGLFHFVFPSGSAEIDFKLTLRMGFFLIIVLASIYLMSLIGFLAAAPIMMAALMLIIGEKRPIWLVLGIVFVPGSIWFVVGYLLNRPLP